MKNANINSFKPNMSLSLWKQRLSLTKQIRSFFENREVLEVETPILSKYSALDPAIDVFASDFFVDGQNSYRKEHAQRYLSTSPEFCMKRLLAAGFPDVFQIAKAFRNGEVGERHNPEFSILEWYRLGWTQQQLMSEVIDLVKVFIDVKSVTNITYKEAFITFCGLDPFKASKEKCLDFCKSQGIEKLDFIESKGDVLDFILGDYICPKLGQNGAQFLIEWPADQAALAKIFQDKEGNQVAARFELFIKGLELCNGYQELTDASEQANRFGLDIAERKNMGKRTLAKDENFLNALEYGMPECSGVALGIDRLFMLALKKNSIKSIMLFSDENS